MFKKILLLSFLCVTTAQADWKQDIAPRAAYATCGMIGSIGGSYALYKILNILVSKLEDDKKISPKNALRIKRYLIVRASLIPILSASILCYSYNSMERIYLKDLLSGFTGHLDFSTGILTPEILVSSLIKDIVKEFIWLRK